MLDVCGSLPIPAVLFYSLFIFYFSTPSWVRQTDGNTWIYSDTLNQHKCHLILTPPAGSLPPASNSAFNISQPKAGHQLWSCHAVLSKQTLLPQTLSACKAPVIQPWNLPTSQSHRFTSPLPSLSLRRLYSLCFWASLSSPTSFLTPRTFFCLPTHLHSLLLLSTPMTPCQRPRDLLSCCDGRGLWDTSCSFNDFAPGPRSAREIQLPFFNGIRTLTPATPLRNMCVHMLWICMWVCVCAQTLRLFILHLRDAAWLAALFWSLLHILKWISIQFL